MSNTKINTIDKIKEITAEFKRLKSAKKETLVSFFVFAILIL